jgi:hypothetical protein
MGGLVFCIEAAALLNHFRSNKCMVRLEEMSAGPVGGVSYHDGQISRALRWTRTMSISGIDRNGPPMSNRAGPVSSRNSGEACLSWQTNCQDRDSEWRASDPLCDPLAVLLMKTSVRSGGA